jgi:hypothetical protein
VLGFLHDDAPQDRVLLSANRCADWYLFLFLLLKHLSFQTSSAIKHFASVGSIHRRLSCIDEHFSTVRIRHEETDRQDRLRYQLTGAFIVASTIATFADNDGTVPVSFAGAWIGTAGVNGHDVPFRLELSGSGDAMRGAFVNGKERSASSSESYSEGHIILHFDYYANTLDATLKDGTLTGTFSGRGHSIPITALLNGKQPVADANAPHVVGAWNVAVENGAKGEHSWKLRIRQNGALVDAVIERIDGDSGNLYGVWRNGAFEVSHFTAAGPSFAVLKPQPDGSLKLETAAHGSGMQSFSARRASAVQQVA